MAAQPKLQGTWKIAEADRKKLEQSLKQKKVHGVDDTVRELEEVLAHWKKLVVTIDASRIEGDLGDGLATRNYKVKGSWTSGEGMPVVDLEMRGKSGPQAVSVLFTEANKVMFQTEGLRLPLQRATK